MHSGKIKTITWRIISVAGKEIVRAKSLTALVRFRKSARIRSESTAIPSSIPRHATHAVAL